MNMPSPQTVRTVVVATDLSPASEIAVDQAAMLARRWDADLVLLHVFNDGVWATITAIYESEVWAGAEPVLVARNRLSQQVRVTSNDVQQIAGLATTSTELIEQGVTFQSDAPRYFYTKIADLKLDMIALATENARARATTIAEKAGSKVRGVRDARAGVFQINPLYTDEVSDYGVNDTTSIEKEISAVVNAELELD